MNDIEIIKVEIKDLVKLQEIGKNTFFETFSYANSIENMNRYLNEGFSIKKLTAELQDPGSEFYFALLKNRVVGYLKLNSGNSQTELKDPDSIEIERIYVLKEFQGKKAGQQLFDKAIKVAKAKDADFVWLGVWEKNHRAISFYKKNGFVEFDKHIFRLGDDEQTDIMMKLHLRA